ncbi:MAG: hypothetical protein ABI892_15575 [Flavobacterium sp.]
MNLLRQEGYEIIPYSGQEISRSGIESLLDDIRPIWRGKNLINRVALLLPVDASSACQRLFNAAIHDLKEKIIVIGVDVAKDTASKNKLPSLSNDEDILEYNVSKSIDLAYKIGILNRAEWRRLHRCYEIRRDLEHEDNEYVAVLEDCFYIFKSVIDIVLSKDPIELLKVTDAKQIIEVSTNLIITEEFLLNFTNAPNLRKTEITKLLVSYADDDSKPDIVRQNSVELMRNILPLTPATVTIEIAGEIEAKIKGQNLDVKTAKISNACGAISYFKKVRLKDFFASILKELKETGNNWESQAIVVAKLEDIGGLNNCPFEFYSDILKVLVLIYIGEPGYGYYRNVKPVFFSNGAAPIIYRILQNESNKIEEYFKVFREDRDIKLCLGNAGVSRRFENLVDISEI